VNVDDLNGLFPYINGDTRAHQAHRRPVGWLAGWVVFNYTRVRLPVCATHAATFFIPHRPSSLRAGTRTEAKLESAMGGGATASDPPANPPPAFRVDRALHALGFEFTRVTADEVVGRLPVTETCCQVGIGYARTHASRRRLLYLFIIYFCFHFIFFSSNPNSLWRVRVMGDG